jgi:hypothetical protein
MPSEGIRVPLLPSEPTPRVGIVGKAVGSAPLAAADQGGRPRFELELLRVPLTAPEAAALPARARGLGRILESSLLQTESALRAESKLIVGDLIEIRVEDVPEPLRAQFKCVRGLQKIDIELKKPGDQTNLKNMTEALQDVHRANPELAARVKNAAAARAEQKGQTELAGKLRNIKLVPAPGAAEPGGVAIDLAPPSAPGAGQAGQEESVLKGLEDLDPEVQAEAASAKRKLNHDLERWADIRYTMGQSYHLLYRLASNQSGKSDDPQEAARRRQQRKQFLLQVAATLGRALRPSERLLVADMMARGYKDEQIVVELRKLDREEDRP